MPGNKKLHVESETDDTFEESESDGDKSDDPGAAPRSPLQVLTRLNTLHLVCPRALVPSVRPLGPSSTVPLPDLALLALPS